MIGPQAFRRLTDLAFRTSQGSETFVSVVDRAGQTARFARNQVVQNVHVQKYTFTVTVAFKSRAGTAATTDLTPQGIVAVVERATDAARRVPDDPEYLPPLPPQVYKKRPTFRAETADARPWRLLDDVKKALSRCKAAELEGAGVVSAYATAAGVAATTGLFAHEVRTYAEFSLTATGPDSSGWVRTANRSIDALGVEERTAIAIEKAKRSGSPREIAPGAHTVILEPAAVAGLLGPLMGAMDARAYHRGTSALSGRLGERIVDERLTLRNDPQHKALLGNGFNGDGLPSDAATWIENGRLMRLAYDRWTGKQNGVAPTYGLDAPHLFGPHPTADLIAGTKRGILVTNFWYIRSVDPTDLTLTGMTRDGTFLVEDGKVTTGLFNFRFHESPLRAFRRIEAYGRPADAFPIERTKMVLPPLRVHDFNFSSVTRF